MTPEVGDRVIVYLKAGTHDRVQGKIGAVFEDGSATLTTSISDGWINGTKIFIPKDNIAYIAWE